MHGSVGRIRSSWLIKKLKDSKLPEVILLLESSSVSELEISYLPGRKYQKNINQCAFTETDLACSQLFPRVVGLINAASWWPIQENNINIDTRNSKLVFNYDVKLGI